MSQIDLAAIQFDRSGTTRIGKYVINHSFILPGLIGVSTSCLIGYLLADLNGFIWNNGNPVKLVRILVTLEFL